ncbi:MAG TPA: T9SS type A sorting domain-containing protein [Bacteroidia bacterium]|jgi:hypothetical protein|nr:T9SS type A sorting domain-containing protein [Bacteroidia bacterium]
MKTNKFLISAVLASALFFQAAKGQTAATPADKEEADKAIVKNPCAFAFDYDNFTNPSAWTVIDGVAGNGSVVVNGTGTLVFSNADFPNTCPSQHGASNNRSLRTYRALTGTLSNHSWRSECRVRITDGNGPTQTLMALTAGTQDPEGPNPGSTSWGCCANNTSASYTPSAQDGIFASLIAFGYDQVPSAGVCNGQLFPGSYKPNAHPGTGDSLGWRIFGHAKSAAHAANFYPALSQVYQAENPLSPAPPLNWSRGILLPALNTDYYMRLERLNSGTCRISIFSDSAMTINIPGSPQCFSIDPTISNLDVFQNAASASGSCFRTTAGYIASLRIFNNCPGGIPNLIASAGAPTPCCTDTLHASAGFTNYTWYPGGINTGNQNWLVVNATSTATTYTVTADLPGYPGCPFTATATVKPCKPKYLIPDPSFSLSGNLPATGNFFTVSAAPTMANTTITGYGSGWAYSWEVDMENVTGAPIYCTVVNPVNWQSALPTLAFPGYASTNTPSCSNSGATTGSGQFYVGYRYRVIRTIKSPCGIYTSSKSIMLCSNCITKDGAPAFTVIDEGNTSTSLDGSPEAVSSIDIIEHSVKVYPNPSKGVFNIELGSSGTGTIEVYDVMGKSVKKLELNGSDTEYKLDLSNYPKGLYLLNIIIDGSRHTERLMLQ